MHVAEYDVGYIDAQHMEANEEQTLNSLIIIQMCSYLCSFLMRFLFSVHLALIRKKRSFLRAALLHTYADLFVFVT
jgi:hypothetical protein